MINGKATVLPLAGEAVHGKCSDAERCRAINGVPFCTVRLKDPVPAPGPALLRSTGMMLSQ